jgi:hypothetical protein
VSDICDGVCVVVVSANFDWPTNLTARIAAPDRAHRHEVRGGGAEPAEQGRPSLGQLPEPGGYDAYLTDCSRCSTSTAEPGSTPTVVLPLSRVRQHRERGSLPASNKLINHQQHRPGGRLPVDDDLRRPRRAHQRDLLETTAAIDIAVPPGSWRFAHRHEPPGRHDRAQHHHDVTLAS